jgi:putative flippase GtrA
MKRILIHISNGAFSRFVAVGLFVLSVENIIIWQITYYIDNYLFARVIATISSLFLAYILNTHFSFSSTYSVTRFISYTKGVSMSLSVSYLVSLGIYYLIFSSSWPLLSTNIGAIAAAICNFLYQKHFTYRRI